mgnify:CR=1 FL=1
MKVDKILLEAQINNLALILNKELTNEERDSIEGILNMIGDILDSESTILQIELI